MEIAEQLATREQCKKLRLLGVNAPAFFMHWLNREDQEVVVAYEVPGIVYHGSEKSEWNYWAYSVAELGEMIPMPQEIPVEAIYIMTWKCDTNIEPSDKNLWKIEYGNDDISNTLCPGVGRTEAICRADMLIYLLENKIITPESCNERLNRKKIVANSRTVPSPLKLNSSNQLNPQIIKHGK